MKKLGFVFFSAIILLLAGCSTTKSEKTSIQALIKQGKIDEAKSFFLTKSDINEQDEDGNTVLHAAALINDEDLVTFLIIKGANKEIKNYEDICKYLNNGFVILLIETLVISLSC